MLLGYGNELVWVILGCVFKVIVDEDLHPMGGGAHSSMSFELSNLTLGPSKLAYGQFSQ